jgi:hypothetical protein
MKSAIRHLLRSRSRFSDRIAGEPLEIGGRTIRRRTASHLQSQQENSSHPSSAPESSASHAVVRSFSYKIGAYANVSTMNRTTTAQLLQSGVVSKIHQRSSKDGSSR